MKRCSSCNYQCEDFRSVCPKCGKPLSASAYVGPGGSAQGRHNAPQPNHQSHRTSTPYGYIMPYDHTMEFSSDEISVGKPYAMINYLFGWIGILICLMNRNNAYVKFHVRQNVKYMVIETAFNLAMSILGIIFFLLACIANEHVYGVEIPVPNTGLLGVSIFFFGLVILVYGIIKIFQLICFIQVCKGRAVEAPLVRRFEFLK